MITLHIRQGRRQMNIQVEEFTIHRSAYSDFFGKFPKDEWEDTCYRGTTPFAEIVNRLHADSDKSFEVREYGSRRNSWQDYFHVEWDDKGWYLTNDTTGC